MTEAMKKGTFDWKKSGPVEFAERNGMRIIIDGHHRVAAAVRAGIKEIPATTRQVGDDAWEASHEGASGHSMEAMMMELIDKIRTFVTLQTALLAAPKGTLGDRDIDVPKKGVVKIGSEDWSFQRHGTRVRFERLGAVVDANRHLEQGSGLFDAGRLVEYLESQGSSLVLSFGKPVFFNIESGGALLEELAARGDITRVLGLSGELFRLNG